MRTFHCAFAFSAITLPVALVAQCGAGEVEVTLQVTTDDYGYESYWQLTPAGDPCGTNTIGEGGNAAVGCAGGGAQAQTPGGYGNNTTYTEGPWCLIEGASFDIHAIDDWGDTQLSFEVFVNGVSVAQFGGTGAENVWTFIAQMPPSRDMSVTQLTTAIYSNVGEGVVVRGAVKNLGSDVVGSFDLNYSIDGGTPVVQNISSVAIATGDTMQFAHAVPWVSGTTGAYALQVWASNINGGADLEPSNDAMAQELTVNEPIPNIIDQYLAGTYIMTEVANSDEDLLVPRDLDFHPDLARNELWVINKDTEASGGSTVKFTDVGLPTQTHLWQRDPNAWHFMSLPTGIAFGNNGNFSTCPGVFDANHNGGTPFTGPTLWSSDPAIYAQPLFGPLGSHLDMLHVTPNAQGIAAENWNRFWVVDGFNGDVVMHDFLGDHGPGNDYHGNAVIRRYDEVQVTRDPADHVVSHCVLDKNTGWLYVVDFGGQRVFRIDTHSGAVSGTGDYGPWETYDEYSMVTGYTHETVVSSGLIQPAGIDVIDDRLLVSDHSNGDIVIYDIGSLPAVELGRIHTASAGIMGIKIGPDGRVWFVNATTHQLIVCETGSVGIRPVQATDRLLSPSITTGQVTLSGALDLPPTEPVALYDPQGRQLARTTLAVLRAGWDLSAFANGTYVIHLGDRAERVVIRR